MPSVAVKTLAIGSPEKGSGDQELAGRSNGRSRAARNIVGNCTIQPGNEDCSSIFAVPLPASVGGRTWVEGSNVKDPPEQPRGKEISAGQGVSRGAAN